MPRFFALIVFCVLAVLGAAAPAAAQSRPGCYPYCDYTHYYGPYDYRYIRPGLYCYPLCRADGSCVPNPACSVQAPRGTVTVRSLAGAVRTTPTTVDYYDPTVLPPGVPPRRYRR